MHIEYLLLLETCLQFISFGLQYTLTFYLRQSRFQIRISSYLPSVKMRPISSASFFKVAVVATLSLGPLLVSSVSVQEDLTLTVDQKRALDRVNICICVIVPHSLTNNSQ